MKEAIIGLVGVVIGGVIGVFGQIILNRFEYKKWRKDRSIELLKEGRKELAGKYEFYNDKLWEGIKKDTYDTEMCFDFMYSFPKNVLEAFDKLMRDKKKDIQSKRSHYHAVKAAMKESLLSIDKEIKKEIRNN